MSERSSYLFQARLGRPRSTYYIPYHFPSPRDSDVTAAKLQKRPSSREKEAVTSKLQMASTIQPAIGQPYSNTKPPIPPRSQSRPRAPNKLQKRRRSESETRSHLGFLIKDARDEGEQYSRGTLGGFWVLNQESTSGGQKRNSSWHFESEADIRPLSIALKDLPDLETQSPRPERPWHQRNSSSSSQESDLSDIWHNAQSSPFSADGGPSWDSDNTSCSSVYSSEYIERAKTPAEVEKLLNSAEVLAEQYRSLLASRACMRTPLPPQPATRGRDMCSKPLPAQPPPVPPKHGARGLSLRTQSSSFSISTDGGHKPRTLRRVVSAHSLRRMTISSHPAFSSSASSDSGNQSEAAFQPGNRNSCSSDSSSPSMPNTPPLRYSIPSKQVGCELSRSVHTLTHQLSSALLLQDFCSPSDSMHDLTRNRKSVIQIQSLIEAYEELQEELELGRVQASEKQMVWEMNGVVGDWLSGLYERNGAKDSGVRH